MTLQALNSPAVKEGSKNGFGAITFFGGIAVLYYHFRIEAGSTVEKTIDYFLKVSIVLSCITRRPGLYLTEKVIERIASPATLQKRFGQNTVFAINPWHPRHGLNITANLLSSIALYKWVFNRSISRPSDWLVSFGVFNFATGRSTLHLANDLWHAATAAKRS
jgi:hypothetical protein